MRPVHQMIKRRFSSYELSHMPSDLIEFDVHLLMQQFKLGERMQKLQPGEQMDIRIKRAPMDEWDGVVEVRIDDRFTGTAPDAPIPAIPQEHAG